jgi:hypothetical protein
MPPAHAGPVQAFLGLIDGIKEDPYLSPHVAFYVREVRVIVYTQVRCALHRWQC